MLDSLEILYNISRPVNDPTGHSYKELAYNLKLSNYRLITSGEFLVSELISDTNFPQYVKNVLMTNNECLLIFNIVHKPIGATIRPMSINKEFIYFGRGHGIFYGLGEIDLVHNDTIVLVEGQKDRDVISKIYKKHFSNLYK